MGTAFGSKIQVILVVLIVLSIIDYVFGLLFEITPYQKVRGMTGFNCNFINFNKINKNLFLSWHVC
jgi:hypothetical protein